MKERPSWFDLLAEGVLLHVGGVVEGMNARAAELLEAAVELAVGRPLIWALRDHRLEELSRTPGASAELELRGRVLIVRSTHGALLLREVSEERRSEREARELLAVLSHELRTPVTGIVAVLDALGTELPEEKRLRFLAQARSEGARLRRLLDDLTVDVRPPRERTVALEGVLRRVSALTSDLRERRGVTLRLDPADLQVRVDEDKLLQALLNLVENAAVHGPPDSEVTLSVSREENSAVIEVLDRGQPFPPSAYEGLFAPRAQGGPKAKGTGLGLYIVRSLARTWGGEAWARARDDGVQGNAFGFSIPLPELRPVRRASA